MERANMVKRGLLGSCSLLLLFGLAACGKNGESAGSSPTDTAPKGSATATPPAEPVTITLGGTATMLNFDKEDSFDKYIAGPVKKKYPNITVKFESTSMGYSKMIAAGQVPDILLQWYANVVDAASLQLTTPIDPLLKKYNFDQSKIDPNAWQSLQNLTNSKAITGVPVAFSRPALFYNKDIFDKFGVKYPESGLTWEQVSALGKKMSQMADGVQYVGFHPLSIFRLQMQLNLPYLDPKTGKAAIDTDNWSKLYSKLQTIYKDQKIPTNLFTDAQAQKAWQQGQIAMIAGYPQLAISAAQGKLNWDMTTYPQSTDKMGYGWRSDGIFALITPNAKDRDSAFKVLEVIDSPEVQNLLSQDGSFPVLSDKSIEANFGKHTEQYKGKNISAFFVYKTSPAIAIPLLDKSSVGSLMDSYFFGNIMKDSEDVNSALRKANEDFQKKMDEASK